MSTSRSDSQVSNATDDQPSRPSDSEGPADGKNETRSKWTLGILKDRETDSVPGSVFLLSGPPGSEKKNAPLGLQHPTHRQSAPSSAVQSPKSPPQPPQTPEKKRTADGKIILDPQPDDTDNDPLNWPTIRRNGALLSLGLYCMLGGGLTPVLAAGYSNVAETYGTTISKIALTVGLYMVGLGVGSVIWMPTAIKFGKRPVYLFTALMLVLTAVWCAASPTFNSLLVARVFQGIAVSPTECLPSSSIAEIFFLHERAYRLGIYTLLLLSGKNLVPLVSAAIIESKSWRWVFWIYAIIAGAIGILLFFLVPETFWDRAPRPLPQRHGSHSNKSGLLSRQLSALTLGLRSPRPPKTQESVDEKTNQDDSSEEEHPNNLAVPSPIGQLSRNPSRTPREASVTDRFELDEYDRATLARVEEEADSQDEKRSDSQNDLDRPQPHFPTIDTTIAQTDFADVNPNEANAANTLTSPSRLEAGHQQQRPILLSPNAAAETPGVRNASIQSPASGEPGISKNPYTAFYQKAPPKSYIATLKPFDGRINDAAWWRLALRPFVLYAYPSILWSAAIYAMSIGWLIVLSEAVAEIYRTPEPYNFTALQSGLVYISPFIGGVLGTAVAGKLSDVIVRHMTRRNGGLYEPEFRLVMAIPVAITTVIGLMGFGWSAEERDSWIVPTVFFGVISFGCSLGSTTAITFAVDSYRMYAGEALVTLNFAKNICHGMVFSLFFNNWLQSDGAKTVFLAIGGVQIAFLSATIPMYIFGKRARMWTTRRNLLGKL
ncbi:MAG: hypothetical protein Q9162_002854 [Coniocarpon cinnabarinum]